MKTIWEPNDVVVGRIVCKPLQGKERHFKPTGWTAKWTYKIGFVNGGGAQNYTLICMCDGMVGRPHTQAELADALNRDKLILMPHGWLMATMEFLRDAY
jgi:hypothetical protein